MFKRIAIAASVLLLLSACVSTTGGHRAHPVNAGLPTHVAAMLTSASIPADAVGAVVIRQSDGAVLLSHQSETSLQPGSTLKVLTSIVALERLGPTYRGRTELRTSSETANGILMGNLVLRGLGNPDMDWEAFQSMLQTLRHKGISEIRGNLLLDRQWFLPSRPDLGVPPFDETPEFRYNVIPDALLLNTNLLQLDIRSGGPASAAAISIGVVPALERVVVVSNMTLVDRACDKWEDGWTLPTVNRVEGGVIRIELLGEFPRNCSAATSINILDRVDFADRLFRALWRNLGGTFSGNTRDSHANDVSASSMRVLASHQSRTMAELTRDINKRSDNPITRLVYLSLGARSPNDQTGETAVRADQEVRAWLKKQGIDDTGLVLDNGSGLSRIERIRPSQLAAVLTKASQSKWAPEFMASMPIVGIDGGMGTRLRNSPAAEWARIKTGTLIDVSAVAGFVPCGANEVCVVVAMINHPLATGDVARPILDAILDWVARRP